MGYSVVVTLTKVDTVAADGVTFDHTDLTVTDAAGAVQTFALRGTEDPAWSQRVDVVDDGVSSYSAQDVDTTGAPIGVAATMTYDHHGAATFPATSAITVTPA